MRKKTKQREMLALRAAGMTLAGADRLTQTQRSSTPVLLGVGAVSVILMAGVSVLGMNANILDETPSASGNATAELMDEQAIQPVPGPAPSAQTEPDLRVTKAQEIVPAADLPWMRALEEAPEFEVQPTPVAAVIANVEIDCTIA